jgi:hypothetical protein
MKSYQSVFKPKFTDTKVPALVKAYGPESDDDALRAGQEIASGIYSWENIKTIFKWKTKGRGISRLKNNECEEIADALRLAAQAETERSAMAVLCGLNGVGVPVASAILTTMFPTRFTVIDFRALQSLGCENDDDGTINFYLVYLNACKDWAEQYKCTLRDLDRALWQYSKDNEQENP